MAGGLPSSALGNGGSQWGASLGTWVLSLLPLRRRRNRCRGPSQERRFPVRTPGNRGSHVGTNEPRFDRQLSSRSIAARLLLLPGGSSRLPRSLSGIQTSRPRPVPSPDSRTGSGAGAMPDPSHADPRARARRGRSGLSVSTRRCGISPRAGRALLCSRELGEWHARCSWNVRAAGILPRSAGRQSVPRRPARCPGADASGHRRSYDVTGGAPAQHSRRGPRATPRRPSSARTSTWTSAQRQRIVT
jgi:hypothetical protein